MAQAACNRCAARLLWVDAGAAAAAGTAVLLLGGWLSDLYRLPHTLLTFIAAVNLLYASYSCSLALRRERSLPWVHALVAGNLAWAAACLAMAWRFASEASGFGLFHLIGEAAFVAALAACEWRWRHRLAR